MPYVYVSTDIDITRIFVLNSSFMREFMYFVTEMDKKEENTARETEGKMMGSISSTIQTLPVAPESPRSPVSPSLTSHSAPPHLQYGLL